jgi:hypothetical protein
MDPNIADRVVSDLLGNVEGTTVARRLELTEIELKG